MAARLLVVHGNAVERRELGSLAENAGFRVDQAGSLAELRSWLERPTLGEARCVLLAMKLPDGDASSAIAACQSTENSPPVILLQDDEEAEALLAAWSAGAHGFLPRQPPSSESLKAAVNRAVLGQHRRLNGSSDPLRIMQGSCHDLRNPLSAMMINANILLRDQALSSERRVKIAERILASANRMSRIIDSVADYAVAGQGKPISVRTAEANLGAIASEALAEARRTYPDRNLVLEQHGDLRGRWDPGRLHSVVSGLLRAALRRGRPHATVQLACIGTDSPAEVQISLEYRDVDTTGEATSPIARNTSVSPDLDDVNLFVAQHIAEAHHGSLTMTATASGAPGFLVRLPKQVAAPPDVAESPARR